MVGLLSAFGYISYHFINELKAIEKSSTMESKHQKSVVISICFQITEATVFSMLPTLFLMMSYVLELPYAGPLLSIFLVMVSVNPVIEILSHLYFVKPYRDFIATKYRSYFKKNNRQISSNRPSVGTVVYSNANHTINDVSKIKVVV